MPTKVLLFGANGQIGTEIRRLSDDGFVVEALGRDQADLAQPQQCAERVRAADADIVINAAAYTAVDRAESDVEGALAMIVNADAPGAMAAAAAARGLPFLHLSTDYVFDGEQERPWRETDLPAPLGAYGRSKRRGEEAVMAAGGSYVILRTGWVFAAHGANFVRTMLRLARERCELRVVDDQRGGPTAARDVAQALAAIANAWRRGDGEAGVFHFSGAPPTTWCGFAREIVARADLAAPPAVRSIPTEAWPTPAARPKNGVLDCQKIARVYGLAQPDWRPALDAVMTDLKDEAR